MYFSQYNVEDFFFFLVAAIYIEGLPGGSVIKNPPAK